MASKRELLGGYCANAEYCLCCSKSSRQCSLRDKVRDKLSKKQYDDEVSWTNRTWSSLMAQRMSVALHMAAAWEIARELSLAGAEDEAALFGGGVADSVA